MSQHLITLKGDGIGHEILPPALELLHTFDLDIDTEDRLIGGASIDDSGEPLTDAVLEDCRQADGVLLASVGGPKWDTTNPTKPRPEQGLLKLRKGMGKNGLYGNLRPVRPLSPLFGLSPLREAQLKGANFLVVRELTGGIYFGERGLREGKTFDRCEYTKEEVERIARVALAAADQNGQPTSSVSYPHIPDTYDNLETAKLWHNTVAQVHAEDFSHLQLEHIDIKAANRQLAYTPGRLGVILVENMLGDIFSDAASVLVGSLGMLPSLSVGDKDDPALAEPAGGSAPDIAGKGIANPMGMFYATAMLLGHLGHEAEGQALTAAVDRAIFNGLRTRDLGGSHTTEEAKDLVLAQL